MKRTQRGMTLLETLIALAVLNIGALATFSLVTVVTHGNRSVAAQSDAVALAGRLASEIGGARLTGTAPNDRDPHLLEGEYGAGTPRAAASQIASFGYFPSAEGEPLPSSEGASFHVRYQVAACADCGGLGGIEVLISVENARAGGPLLRAAQIALRREHLRSASGTNEVRGW